MANDVGRNERMADKKYMAGIEGLEILDSGCSNGTVLLRPWSRNDQAHHQLTIVVGRWLRDLQHACRTTKHDFVGTDAAPNALPKDRSDGLEYYVQDIIEDWPESWAGSFDLIHQRTVLVNARKAPMQSVLAPLTKLLKNGGCIQLMEVEFPELPENGPAMHDFLGVAAWFWDKAGPGKDLGPRLKQELENLGMKNVEDCVANVGFGAKLKAKAPEVVYGSVEGLCCAVPGSLTTFQSA